MLNTLFAGRFLITSKAIKLGIHFIPRPISNSIVHYIDYSKNGVRIKSKGVSSHTLFCVLFKSYLLFLMMSRQLLRWFQLSIPYFY